MVFKTPEFFKRVVIVGSGVVANRAPLLIGELVRKCEDTIRISRTYYSRTNGKGNVLSRALLKAWAAAWYHLLLPVSIFRSQMVFLLPSNNTEILTVNFWARLFGRPVLVDYYVSIYEWSCFMQGSGDPSSRRGRKLLAADRAAYLADGAIHCNRAEWFHIAEVIGLPPREEGFHLLPLFTDFDQLVDRVLPPPAEGPFVFGWWGSSMPLHGLGTIVQAFELLAAERSGFELHLCFWGEQRRREFESGRNLDSMPWLKIHDHLIAADGSLPRFINERVHVGFSHFGTGPTADYVYTNKVLECMALGRTALVAECPGNREYGDLESHYYLCKPEPAALKEAAARAMDDGEGRREKEHRCRELFHARYGETAAKQRFRRILDDFHAASRRRGAN